MRSSEIGPGQDRTSVPDRVVRSEEYRYLGFPVVRTDIKRASSNRVIVTWTHFGILVFSTSLAFDFSQTDHDIKAKVIFYHELFSTFPISTISPKMVNILFQF